MLDCTVKKLFVLKDFLFVCPRVLTAFKSCTIKIIHVEKLNAQEPFFLNSELAIFNITLFKTV